MANKYDKLLSVAFAEENYLEKRSNSGLDDKTSNAGQNNYTKYWRDMKPSFQGQPWCDCYVGWCFKKAYGEEIAQRLLCGGLYSFYCPTSAQYFANQGRLDKNPQIGDQIFFTKNSLISGAYHTGIVYAVNKDYVYTIEGNTSTSMGVIDNGGGVAKKAYSRNFYNNRMLFGHPDYSIIPDETSKKDTKKEDKLIKPLYQIDKRYLLTKDLTVRNAPSVNSVEYNHNELTENLKAKDKNKDGKIDKGVTVQCYAIKKLDNGNIWIRVANARYWVLAYKKDGNKINLTDLK